MNTEIQSYNDKHLAVDKEICHLLATTIDSELTEAESKIWHANRFGFSTGIRLLATANRKQDKFSRIIKTF
jgi:hypothetical protein